MQDNGDVVYTCCDVGPYATYTPGYYDDSCTTVNARIIDPIGNWEELDMCDASNSGYMVTNQLKGLTPYTATCLDSFQEWEQLGNVVAMRGINFFSSECPDALDQGADSQLQISVECCMVTVPSDNPVFNAAVGLPSMNIMTRVGTSMAFLNPSIIETAKAAFASDDVDTKNIAFAAFWFECYSDESSAAPFYGELWFDELNMSDERKQQEEVKFHIDNVWKTPAFDSRYLSSTELWERPWLWEITVGQHCDNDLVECDELDFAEWLIANQGSQFTCTLYAEAHDCSPPAQSMWSDAEATTVGCDYRQSGEDYFGLEFTSTREMGDAIFSGSQRDHGENFRFSNDALSARWVDEPGANPPQEQVKFAVATKTFDSTQFSAECMSRQNPDWGYTQLGNTWVYTGESEGKSSYCCVGEPNYENTYTEYEYVPEVTGFVPSPAYEIYPQGTSNGYDGGFCLGMRSSVVLSRDDAE